jgi:hypothetical protein
VSTHVYFLNASVRGKLYQYSWRTTEPGQAQMLRDQEIAKIKKALGRGNDAKGALTLQQAFDLYVKNLEARRELEGKSDDGISAKTLVSYNGAIKKLKEQIPAADLQAPLRKITLEKLKHWLRPVQRD